MTLTSHGRVVLLLPYTRQLFFSTAFPPFRDKLPPKKTFYPYFLGNFFRTFFTVVYVLTGATNDPGLTVPRFAVWGWGQKQIFEMGEKWFFIIAKKIRKCSFPTHLSATESYCLYITEILGEIPLPVLEFSRFESSFSRAVL